MTAADLLIPDCPGWTIRIDEFVPGGYQLDAMHIDGRSFIRTGTDHDLLLKGTGAV
jgi:hypothetical protein